MIPQVALQIPNRQHRNIFYRTNKKLYQQASCDTIMSASASRSVRAGEILQIVEKLKLDPQEVLSAICGALQFQFDEDQDVNDLLKRIIFNVVPLFEKNAFDHLSSGIGKGKISSESQYWLQDMPVHIWGNVSRFFDCKEYTLFRKVDRFFNRILSCTQLKSQRRHDKDKSLILDDDLLCDMNDCYNVYDLSVSREIPHSLKITFPCWNPKDKTNIWMRKSAHHKILACWCRRLQHLQIDNVSGSFWGGIPIEALFGNPQAPSFDITAETDWYEDTVSTISTFALNYNEYVGDKSIDKLRRVSKLTISDIFHDGPANDARDICQALKGNYEILDLQRCYLQIDTDTELGDVFHSNLRCLRLGMPTTLSFGRHEVTPKKPPLYNRPQIKFEPITEDEFLPGIRCFVSDHHTDTEEEDVSVVPIDEHTDLAEESVELSDIKENKIIALLNESDRRCGVETVEFYRESNCDDSEDLNGGKMMQTLMKFAFNMKHLIIHWECWTETEDSWIHQILRQPSGNESQPRINTILIRCCIKNMSDLVRISSQIESLQSIRSIAQSITKFAVTLDLSQYDQIKNASHCPRTRGDTPEEFAWFMKYGTKKPKGDTRAPNRTTMLLLSLQDGFDKHMSDVTDKILSLSEDVYGTCCIEWK